MKGGGKGNAAPDANATCCDPERPFGRDMDSTRRVHIENFADAAARKEAEPDFRISRARQSGETLRGKEMDRKALLAKNCRDDVERAHDAVNLGVPSVGDDQHRRHSAA